MIRESDPGITSPDRPVLSRQLRVLSIAHPAVKRAIGRIRYERLVSLYPDIRLTVVAPNRWQEYGQVMAVEPPLPGLDLRLEEVRLQHVARVGWYLHYYPGLRRLIKEVQPDVIHLWEEPWSVVALQAARLRNSLAPNAALVLETDQNILRRFPPPFEQIRQYTLRQTDLLIGRQDESLDVSRARGFTGATAIVEYGIDDELFHVEPGSGSADTAAPSPSHPLVLGYVGRIVREKGLHDVVEAMARASAPTVLRIVGQGPDREALEAKAQELGLGDRVAFLPSRPPAEVACFMGELDALVLMSRTTATWKEQFGRVIMESQACGTPVIGSDSGSIPGVVVDGGWIVPEGDVTALAALIDRIAGDPEGRMRARQAGLEQARTRFSFNAVARSLGEAFKTAARARQSPPRRS